MATCKKRLYPPPGVPKGSGLISITAANTTTAVFTRSTNRSRFRITKIWAYNRTSTPVVHLRFGDSSFTQRLPDIDLPRDSLQVYTEDQIPHHEFTANLQAQVDAAGASPNDVQLLVEVEEW